MYGNSVLTGITIEKGVSMLRLHDPNLAKSARIADRIYKNQPVGFDSSFFTNRL